MKNKVLLVSLLKNSHRNLSCLALYAYLRDNGVLADILFLPRESECDMHKLSEFLVSSAYPIVGLSVVTDGARFAKELTKEIRKTAQATNHNIHITWGGIHPTLAPKECLEDADSVIIGEGELSFLSFVRNLDDNYLDNENLRTLEGVGLRTKEGHSIINKPAKLISDLNTLPSIRYEWENFYILDNEGLRNFTPREYIKYSNYDGEDYTIMTTRSCPFSCNYCCNSYINELYGIRGKFRRRSVNLVIEELKNAVKTIHTIKFINFIDDQFVMDKKWNDDFCVAYKNEVGLPFTVRLTPGTFKEEEVIKLKEAGMMFATVGIQSGSARINKEIFNRHFNKDKIIEASKIFSKTGIHPFYDVIIHNDFEDESDRIETIKLLLELEKPYALNFFALTPFPNTKLSQIYKEKNIKPKTDPYDKLCYSKYDETDFYFQLAYIIPMTSKNICSYFLENAKDAAVKKVLEGFYHSIKDTHNKVTQSQLTIQSNHASHKTKSKNSE